MLTKILLLMLRRLEQNQQEKIKRCSIVNTLEQKKADIKSRIEISNIQLKIYEQSGEVNKILFLERLRFKALLLKEIAFYKYQIDTINQELDKNYQIISQLASKLLVLNYKCEKFRNYLKQKNRIRCLKLEYQQQNEIEELLIYVHSKVGDK